METNAKKLGAMKLKQVIDGCNTLLGTLKIRVEDIEETGSVINIIRGNLSQCSAYVETDIINAADVAPAPIEPAVEEPTVEEPQLAEEEVVADDGNSHGKPEPESEPAADEPTT